MKIPSKAVLALVLAGAVGFAARGSGASADSAGEGAALVLVPQLVHLGDDDKSSWERYGIEKPEGRRLEREFSAWRNSEENTLELTAGDVGEKWRVILNDRRLGKLRKKTRPTVQYFDVPEGLLKERGNELLVRPSGSHTDDIWVGDVRLHRKPEDEVRRLSRLRVKVRDGEGRALPARLSVARAVGEANFPIDLELDKDDRLAVRPGLVYSLDGEAEIELPPGAYRIWATRGYEYSRAELELALSPGDELAVELTIEREVDTKAWIAADTHIHTRTYSGHGDATVEERVVTIAGEGIELAVATDHNHHTDYRKVTRELEVEERFRSVVGNEVTTKIGHFNAFPVDPEAEPPKHEHEDWVKLFGAIRATSGLRVVVVNHPRRGGFEKGPLGRLGFDPLSGEVRGGDPFPEEPERLGFHALEVLNASDLREDPYDNFRDWFALLDRGHRVIAVAGSDSHTVKDPVGLVRTYVRSSVDDPARLRVKEVVDNLLAGRALVSVGLLVELELGGRHRVGDLATGLEEELEIDLRVAGPSWVRADRVALFLNGRLWREGPVPGSGDSVEKYRATWTLPRPTQDGYLVLVATGPPVDEPTHRVDDDGGRYVLGATNPIWIDADGDGEYSSPRATAVEMLARFEDDAAGLRAALARSDEAVAIQAAGLVQDRVEARLCRRIEALRTEADRELETLLEVCRGAGREKRPRLEKYLLELRSLDSD